jgi:hypothetical protein
MRCIAITLTALLIATSASARTKVRPDPELDRLAATPVSCDGAADCEMKWAKALVWVLNNSEYQLQIQTDSLIKTYGAAQWPHGTAFTVLKTPLGEGRYAIELRGECASTPYCGAPLRDRKAGFVRQVMGIR